MNPNIEIAKKVLKKYWGYDTFRSQQEQIINSLITHKKDTLVLMPTGGGKSLCYQIPGIINEGLCIVVSPLVALIEDQVEHLKEKGIKAKGLTGHIPFSELIDILDACEYGKYTFLYLSPERLLQDVVLDRLQKMKIGLIAIDEAHCISEWGNDFRPKYLELQCLKEHFPNTPFVALTATAPSKVKNDIISILKLKEFNSYQSSYLRKNLSYGIYTTEDIHYLLKKILTKQQGCSIIYVPTRAQTLAWTTYLNEEGFSALPYHGGMDGTTKKKNFDAWKDNKVRIIIATNAFGMGIDKADVRTVIHTYIPLSIESYFQEAGRAGRDGKQAYALLLQTPNAIHNLKDKKNNTTPDIDYIKKVYRKLSTYLQIAYGEGQEQYFPIDFVVFCERYQLSKAKTYKTLKMLNNHGILSLIEKHNIQWSITMEVGSNHFSHQISSNSTSQKIGQQLLRDYTGIFSSKTKIDLSKIASKTAVSQNIVKNQFDQWAHKGLIIFEEQNCDLEIEFLVPREDDITINSVSKHIKSSIQHQKRRIEATIQYITNTIDCRQQQLLKYFGETLEKPCNNCSNCIKQQKKRTSKNQEITVKMISILEKTSLTSRVLFEHFTESEEQLIAILQQLLAQKKIAIQPDNTYQLVFQND